MADILVSALLQTVLGNFNSISIQEIGLAWGSENELNDLKSKFETINSLLQDAEMKQRKSLTLQNWLRKLKNDAYDADNILDQIATEGLRRRMESERGNHHKLKAFFSQRNPLMFRFKIAQKVRNVRERLDVILDEGSKLGLTRVEIMDSQNDDALEDRQTSSLVNESEIYGRNEEKKMVIEKLLDYVSGRDDFSVYAICGMGGIGKTTLAQLVYNDQMVVTHFELRIWVCVSVDFSVPRLVRAIIESIEGGGCNISELDPLMQRLQEKLRGRRFLLVLDDVWSDDNVQWDKLKEALRFGSKGSTLLVTTRTVEVATMMATVDIHHLKCLAEDVSWTLFRKRAFANGKGDENLEEIGKEIVRKCGGVPLAVKALGSLMRKQSSEREWLAIKQSEIWHLRDDDNRILPALRLSYDNLSPQIRQCFAYCCIFPKDEVMEVDKLVELWMANGFIHSERQTDLPLAGHLIFKELVWRSFFQEVQKNNEGKIVCKIHDLMHDLAESVMRNEAHMVNIGNELNIPKGVHHLSIWVSLSCGDNEDWFKFSTDVSLRSIAVHQRASSPQGFSSFISKQKYIRVFDCAVQSIPVFRVHKMEHLRYLVISCQGLKELPESITRLQNLQTLKLRYSYHLLELPKEFRNMADILVSALLQTVLGNFNSISIQEIGLAWGSENELNDLKSKFQTINSLLQDAEMKQRKSLTLQNWLRNLKNAAYDADNILDQIATEGLRQRMESERGNHHKLEAFFSQRNPLMFRLKVAQKVRNVRERLDVILDEGSKLGLTSLVTMYNQSGHALEDRQTSSLVNESEIYGRDEEKKVVVETLLNYMSNRDDLSVYAISGMGGIGKTTLAQLVYNDERVDNHFELRIWVCVSVDFSIPRLVRAILESIEGGGCNISELDPLMRRLQEKLKGRKFLMVLDDVWSDDNVQWDKLKEALRCGSNGSVLLVTTRIKKVALMMAAADTHHLRYLSEEESMSLFRKRAFAAGEADKNLEKISKEIVRKCGGVPLAVKALGSLMRYKSSESEWLAIQQSEMWNLSDGDNGILPALRLSYDNLSPQMRQCFAYCCIFPKDELMEVDELIALWMANGFIQCQGQTDMRLAGHLIFKELVWKSFFQEVQINHKGKMVCKIHDLMHDLAESVMRNETHKLKVGDDFKIPKGVRHLSILGSYNFWGDTDKLKSPTGRSLRSIILQRTNLPQGFSSFISKQKELRVLDLSITNLSPYPIHKMEHLRYLVMACNTLKKLPESITCLLNLQTLKLMNCDFLLELPKSLRYMKSLYFLHIDNYTSLLCTPPGLGELTCLQKLSIFIVGRDSAHGIGQLKDLNLGGKLCIKGLGCIRDLNDAKSANLVSKKNLTCLSWKKKGIEQNSAEHYEEVLEGLQPNENLEEIIISMYQGSKFPNWMSALSFNNLLRITLHNCYRCECLPPLGKSPSLTYLELCGMDSVKRLDGEWHGINNGESGSFPALKELYIIEMPNLEEWKIPDTIESFPCLETLSVLDCPKLKELPFLGNLKRLTLWKVHTAVVRSVTFLTSLTELHLGYFSELDVLLEGLRNDQAEMVQPLSNLRRLEIWDSEGLCSLPNWLGSLQSLSEIEISSCPDLNSLPDDLQNLRSLKKLSISHCPVLEKRCEKPNGEDCPKISHIPEIIIK